MRERTQRRAMERLAHKRAAQVERATPRYRDLLDDPGFRDDLGLPEGIEHNAASLDVLAIAQAHARTPPPRPTPHGARRYGLESMIPGE